LIADSLGLRQGEVLGLAWRDVDLDQHVLVRQRLQYRPGEDFHLVPPKTARSRRTVPLPDAVVDASKLRREQQETDRPAAGVEFWED
jgi:integrase